MDFCGEEFESRLAAEDSDDVVCTDYKGAPGYDTSVKVISDLKLILLLIILTIQ